MVWFVVFLFFFSFLFSFLIAHFGFLLERTYPLFPVRFTISFVQLDSTPLLCCHLSVDEGRMLCSCAQIETDAATSASPALVKSAGHKQSQTGRAVPFAEISLEYTH